jgi:hypothetical protein
MSDDQDAKKSQDRLKRCIALESGEGFASEL